MKLIIFGKLSFNDLYFLYYAISSLIRAIFSDILFNNYFYNPRYFYSMYLVTISRYFSIIPFLINKKLTKGKEGKIKEQKKIIIDNNANNLNNGQKSIKEILKATLKISIFEFLADLIFALFYFINDNPKIISSYTLQIYSILNTVAQYLVSYFVLNYHFYSHHYLSFGINIFFTFIFLIIDIIEIIKRSISEYQFYMYILMRIIRLFFYALGDNYVKIALYKYFLSPFSLMLVVGIEETIFLFICSIPFLFIKSSDTNKIVFADCFNFLTGINFLYSFIILLCNFFYESFLFIIVDRFSPSHLPLGFILDFFLNNIYRIIKNKIKGEDNGYFLYIYIFIYIFLFIAAMIHNEIIIINRCGFNENTKLFLDDKVEQEIKENESLIDAEEYYSYEIRFSNPDEKLIPLEDMSSKNSN